MQLKVTVFLFRSNGSLRYVPIELWRLVINGRRALLQHGLGPLKVIEVSLASFSDKSHQIRSIRLGRLTLAADGYIKQLQWRTLPKQNIYAPIYRLLRGETDYIESVMPEYFDAMFEDVIEISDRSVVEEDSVQQYVDDICVLN